MSRFSKNQKITLAAVGSLMVIIILGLVYATFTQQLTINGSATGRSSSWRVYFSSLSNVSLTGTAKEITAPEIDSNNQTSIGDYEVTVTSPGDSVEYTFDVTNSGDYDATLTGLNKTNPTCTGDGANASTDATNVCGKLTYTLKYADGTTVAQNDTLKSKETKTMKLKLTYNTFDDASLLPKADVAITGLGITLTYSQDGNAKVNPDGTTPYVKPYAVGDEITVAGEQYYVISVPSNDDYVVALKANPLTTSELNTYGAGHLNLYNAWSSDSYYHQADNNNGIGGMAYYTSANCGQGTDSNSTYSGCTTSYAQSEVKYAVDAWATSKFTNSELKTVDGYGARLVTFDELQVGQREICQTGNCWQGQGVKYDWMYNNDYWYWTMTPDEDSASYVRYVRCDGPVSSNHVNTSDGAVRPVINVYKSKISS